MCMLVFTAHLSANRKLLRANRKAQARNPSQNKLIFYFQNSFITSLMALNRVHWDLVDCIRQAKCLSGSQESYWERDRALCT